MKRRVLILTAVSALLACCGASANTPESAWMVFEGPLTEAVGGVYTGTIPMTEGNYYVTGGPGASTYTGGGFDVYAKQGGCAYVEGYYGTGAWNCAGLDTYNVGYYSTSPHDAYPNPGGPWGSWYNPDCADWDKYSLELTADHWYLRYTPSGYSPMSGSMLWPAMYAAETDLGTQGGGHGGSANHGGGRQAWDCDWGWGVEVIPLEWQGFDVEVTPLTRGDYRVILKPRSPTVLKMTIDATECYEEDEQFVVEVEVYDQPLSINGLQFSVEYDASVLQFVQADRLVSGSWWPTPQGNSFTQGVTGDTGWINAAFGTTDLNSVIPPGPPVTVSRFTFTVLDDTWCGEGLVHFRDLPTYGTKVSFRTSVPPYEEAPLQLDLPSVNVGNVSNFTWYGQTSYSVQCEAEAAAIDDDLTATGCGDVVVSGPVETNNGGTGCETDPLEIYRTYTATDACDNTDTNTITITVVDDTDPTISCPPDMDVACLGDIPAPATDVVGLVAQGGSASDNCVIPTITSNDVSSGWPVTTVTRTYTATDLCGNDASCTQVFTLIDETPPVIQCPENATIECDQVNDIEPDGWNHKMHFPQLPDAYGWDINATAPRIVADDWQCSESGSVKDIHFWGSWKDDELGAITQIHVSIHGDLPASVSPTGYSMPAMPALWERDFSNGDFIVTEVEPQYPLGQGWFDPVTGEYLPGNHSKYYRYDITNIPDLDAFQQVAGQIYWLDISVTVADPVNTQWGWKTTLSPWNDDGVYWDGETWRELREIGCPIGCSNGKYSETYAGGGPGQPGNMIHALSDAVDQWSVTGAQIDGNGAVQVGPGLYETHYVGGVLSVDSSLWGGTGIVTAPLSYYKHVTDVSGGTPVTTVTAIAFVPGGPVIYLNAMATEVGEGDETELPLDYPVYLPDPYVGEGHWGTVYDVTIRVTTGDSLDLAFVITAGGAPPLLGQAYAEDNCDGVLPLMSVGNESSGFGIWYFDDITQLTGCNGTGTITRTWTAVDQAGNYSTCMQTINVEDSTPPAITCPPNYTIECDQDPDEPGMAKMHFPQHPDPTGWDVDATNYIIADDWRCTQTGPITDIRFWGSWKDDLEGDIESVHLSIHEDIPAAQSSTGYSMPGTLLWSYDAYSFDEIELDPSMQGWFDPVNGYLLNNHTRYFRYDVHIPVAEQFQQVENTIYWLDIQVTTSYGVWGWKTSRNHWNDDAVFWDGEQWKELLVPVQIDLDDFWALYDGQYFGGGGSGWDSGRWILYPGPAPDTYWYNTWFENPYDPDDPKKVHIEFYLYASENITVALNWSVLGYTDPIPPMDNGVVVREQFPAEPGFNSFDYTIPFCPRWVSMDVLISAEPPSTSYFEISNGIITHACLGDVESLDMAFVMMGPDLATAIDNCDEDPVITYVDNTSGLTGCNGTGTIVRIWTATDGCGNQNTCNQIITVVDTTPPQFTSCPSDQTLSADDDCEALVPDLASQAAATDNCGSATITQNPDPNTPIGLGDTVVTLTAADDCGNATPCYVTVTVIDSTNPTIDCPDPNDVDPVDLDNNCEGVLPDMTDDVIVHDNCTSALDLDVTQSPAAGAQYTGPQTVTVTITVEDEAGNTNSCDVDVEFKDNIDPIITTCPLERTLYVDSNCEAQIPNMTSEVVADDNCDDTLDVTQDPSAGTVVEPEDSPVTVTMIVTDDSGNSDTCTVTVYVRDNTNPTIMACPPDRTLSVNNNCEIVVPDLCSEVIATDDCDENLECTQDPSAGETYGLDESPVIVVITVKDDSDNMDTCQVTLTLTDNTPPLIDCPPDRYVQCSGDVPTPALNYAQFVLRGGTASDNCGPVTVVWLSDVSDHQTCPETILRTYEAKDQYNNPSQCVQTIVVDDTLPPTTDDCPEDIILPPIDSSCSYAYASWNAPSWSDNCTASGNLIVTSSHASGSSFPVGTTAVAIKAKDACGNEGVCTFNVTVLDGAYVDATVELTNINATAPFTRCIDFQISDCEASPEPYQVDFEATMHFNTSGTAHAVIGPLVCGDYGCISARDVLHTLRSTTTVSLDPATGYWVANFTYDPDPAYDHALLGGNATFFTGAYIDDHIDIIDFGMLATQFGQTAPDIYASTNCATAGPHTDFTGDGTVNLFDFTCLADNIWKVDQLNCCAPPMLLDGGGPQSVISVKELHAMGLGYLAVVDVNKDGWLDIQDVLEYIQQLKLPNGVEKPTVPPEALQNMYSVPEDVEP